MVEVIPGTIYRELFTREEVVRNLTVKALSTLVFRLMGELEQVHTCKLDQRLANFLLSNASDLGTIHMTQQQLASHLGTTREVVARLIQGFTAHGLVRTGRGTVTITDAKSLSDLSIPVP
jgi:CRP/FNR family transcriptional regulator